MIRRKHLAAALAALFLSGCAGADLLAAGQPADLGDGVSIVPTTAWAKVHSMGAEPILTIDGIGLDEVHYYMGVEPGKPIMTVAGVPDKEVGAYTTGMLPNDVMDLLVGTLSKAGAQGVHASHLAPAKFGAVNGFKFALAFVTRDGLDMRGEALIAQRGGKLDALVFVAPQEYYFARRLPDAEQLFATVQAN